MRKSDFQKASTKELLRYMKEITKELEIRNGTNGELDPALFKPALELVEKYHLNSKTYEMLCEYINNESSLSGQATILDFMSIPSNTITNDLDLTYVCENNLYSSLIQFCSEYDISYMRYPIAIPVSYR